MGGWRVEMARKRPIERWASTRLAVRYAGPLEVLAGLVAAAALVFVAQHLPVGVASLLGALHLGYPLALLNGTVEPTDVGLNVAQTKAWLDPALTAYQPASDTLPLIGASWKGPEPHTHLPMEIPLFIPLTLFAYVDWVPFWAATMLLAMGWSLRLMSVRPRYAYAIACLSAATPPGYYALQSTYPMIAAALAFAWRSNGPSSCPRALAMVVAGAGRAIGLLPLGHFLLERRWSAFAIACLALLALTGLAVLVEPGMPRDVVVNLLPAVQRTVERPDNIAVTAVLQRLVGNWSALVLPAIGAVVLLIARAPKLRLMAFIWGTVAASPVAWSYTWAQALPLLAFAWSLGRLGRLTTVLAAATIVTLTKTEGFGWSILVVAMAIPLVATSFVPTGDDALSPAARVLGEA